jgi:FkbM family methyltransferase
MNPIFPLRHLAPVFGLQEVALNIRGFGRMIIRTNSSDACTLRQVFRDHDYDVMRFPQGKGILQAYTTLLKRHEIPIIIDAGANIGAAAIWFAKVFPQAFVLAIEPEPHNADLCRRNVASVERITVIEAALGATPGHSSISKSAGQSWSFQTFRSHQGTIPTVTIAELVKSIPNGRLFAAKIDIEGSESDVFSQNTEWLDDVTFLFLEPHDWLLPGAKTSREFQKRVAQNDFDLVVAGENLLYVSSRDFRHSQPVIPPRSTESLQYVGRAAPVS